MDVKKINIQLKHATKTAISKYLKLAGLWSAEVETILNEFINECECRLASGPTPHAKVGRSPPSTEVQRHISLYLVHTEENNFIHVVDHCTGWSEAGYVNRKSMDVQIRVLTQIQLIRHGCPTTIQCDREYDNVEFKKLCASSSNRLNFVAANDHEANGLIENANRTLRSFFNRLRLFDRRSTTTDLVAEALFGKDVSLGSLG